MKGTSLTITADLVKSCYNMLGFYIYYSQQTPHSSPIKVRYWMSIMSSKPDLLVD